MNQNKLDELLGLFVEGKISKEEYDQLFIFLANDLNDEMINYSIDQELAKMKTGTGLSEEEKNLIYCNISEFKHIEEVQNLEVERPVKQIFKTVYQVGIAASILIMLSVGLYFYTNRTIVQPIAAVKSLPFSKEQVIAPGGNKAILTLSDGSRIILQDAKNGVVANQSGVSIQKTSDGELLYSFAKDKIQAAGKLSEKIVYNKIETPTGGKYQINLPDGSKVWLNSSSTLRYPALFSGNTREVELSGEAYFDVAKDKTKPFKVITKDQIVEVLGTQFNINSYPDEGTFKTTLIEGSVKIIYKDEVVLLSPGQQFQPNSRSAKVQEADTEEVLAWKNGYFLFKNEDIQSIMRKLSRWYNVEVSYSGEIPHVGFGGNISRSKDISEVLKVLQLTNAVHFKVEERRITVMR